MVAPYLVDLRRGGTWGEPSDVDRGELMNRDQLSSRCSVDFGAQRTMDISLACLLAYWMTADVVEEREVKQ